MADYPKLFPELPSLENPPLLNFGEFDDNFGGRSLDKLVSDSSNYSLVSEILSSYKYILLELHNEVF